MFPGYQYHQVTDTPSTSKAQHRFMEAAAHDPGFARRAGISQATAAEFAHADKGRVAALPERKRPKIKRIRT